MKLKELSLQDCEQVRQWRNQQLEMLRTSFFITQKQQEDFYYNVVCNRKANSRYFKIWVNEKFENPLEHPLGNIYEYDNLIGMTGIENISWENRLGEISLIFNPELTKRYFEEGLSLILDYGFNNLNLENIFTEVYMCNLNHELWENAIKKYNGYAVTLPNRKFYKNKYFKSTYINFNKERYNENK